MNAQPNKWSLVTIDGRTVEFAQDPNDINTIEITFFTCPDCDGKGVLDFGGLSLENGKCYPHPKADAKQIWNSLISDGWWNYENDVTKSLIALKILKEI